MQIRTDIRMGIRMGIRTAMVTTMAMAPLTLALFISAPVGVAAGTDITMGTAATMEAMDMVMAASGHRRDLMAVDTQAVAVVVAGTANRGVCAQSPRVTSGRVASQGTFSCSWISRCRGALFLQYGFRVRRCSAGPRLKTVFGGLSRCPGPGGGNALPMG